MPTFLVSQEVYYSIMLNYDKKEFQKHCLDEAEYKIKRVLVIKEIAKIQNIIITDEEINNIITEKRYDYDNINIDDIKYSLLERKVVDFLYENSIGIK